MTIITHFSQYNQSMITKLYRCSIREDVLKERGHSRWPEDGTRNTVAQDVSGHCTHIPVLRESRTLTHKAPKTLETS